MKKCGDNMEFVDYVKESLHPRFASISIIPANKKCSSKARSFHLDNLLLHNNMASAHHPVYGLFFLIPGKIRK
jgi:hypothetical protein